MVLCWGAVPRLSLQIVSNLHKVALADPVIRNYHGRVWFAFAHNPGATVRGFGLLPHQCRTPRPELCSNPQSRSSQLRDVRGVVCGGADGVGSEGVPHSVICQIDSLMVQ
jgi:hypothetical protein